MSATYSDVQPLLPTDETEPDLAAIAAALSANPVTVRSIPRAPLRTWLAETGLLRAGVSGWTGWLVTLAGTATAIAPAVDWLCAALSDPDLKAIRTDTAQPVAAALEAIQAAYTAAPDGIPVAVEDVDLQLLEWTGGRRIGETTVEDVQALMDAQAADVSRLAAHQLADEGYHRARVAIDNGETDWQAIVDAFATQPPPPEPEVE
jgi:hypothetical protein